MVIKDTQLMATWNMDLTLNWGKDAPKDFVVFTEKKVEHRHWIILVAILMFNCRS